MPLITLLTDFGSRDEYVGVMKGVIAGVNPEARVIDICHHIEPQNIVHGAFILAAAYAYFPAGTVHAAVVDPGVGGDRRILALEGDGHRFVVPDNGLIERVMASAGITTVVAVEKRRYFREPVSPTFHGRDIFAPVAAHLSAGLPLTELGPGVDHRSLAGGIIPKSRMPAPETIEGVVVAADHFGNLLTNIDADDIDRLARRAGDGAVTVEVADRPIGGLVPFYGAAAGQVPLAVLGSRGLLEVSVNCGNAREVLKAAVGDRVCVRIDRAPVPSDISEVSPIHG
ncbi:MAG TPA: SAM-dependent chlorinase/fluorinase [Desulfosarcina sp.]|nr:SAM-dependent chlorinase/fluorinase [Desulfosarcina sp.]